MLWTIGATVVEKVNAGVITLDVKHKEYTKGKTVLIPQGIKHHILNEDLEKVVFIEAQIESYFGEDHIVRIEDDIKEPK